MILRTHGSSKYDGHVLGQWERSYARFLNRFQAVVRLPDREGAELFARYEKLVERYYHVSTDLVSCHSDLFKPDNILFDGDRLRLVDREAAFLNDRYADLAVVANLLGLNAEAEGTFLNRYFGGLPREAQVAKLVLMRQPAHVFRQKSFADQSTSTNCSLLLLRNLLHDQLRN